MRIVAFGAGLALFAMAVEARPQYDRNLEKAVMRIVAAKMGDIRGGLDYDAAPKLTLPRDIRATASVPAERDGWVDGLAPARDPSAPPR